MRVNTIFVIDTQGERRAEVCRVLLEGERHAEPFESVAEFLAFGRAEGIALVHDEDGASVQLCAAMRTHPLLVPVIGYDRAPDLGQAVAAMQAGAASFLAWPFTLEAFAAEIDRIAPALEREIARKRRVAHARGQIGQLTPREQEVLASLITHGTNKAIAKELEISPRTVEKYRAAILKRLEVENTAQAVRLAVEGGVFEERAQVPPASPAHGATG